MEVNTQALIESLNIPESLPNQRERAVDPRRLKNACREELAWPAVMEAQICHGGGDGDEQDVKLAEVTGHGPAVKNLCSNLVSVIRYGLAFR